MSITQEMIENLFAPSDGSDKISLTDASNREHARFPFRGRARAIVFPPQSKPNGEASETEILTTDISRTGLSILHREELQPQQQVLLILARGNCIVEVCWCCQVWPGLFAAGCRFLDITTTR